MFRRAAKKTPTKLFMAPVSPLYYARKPEEIPKKIRLRLAFSLNIVINNVKNRYKSEKTPEIFFLRLEF